jgi:hypothetical protein
VSVIFVRVEMYRNNLARLIDVKFNEYRFRSSRIGPGGLTGAFFSTFANVPNPGKELLLIYNLHNSVM